MGANNTYKTFIGEPPPPDKVTTTNVVDIIVGLYTAPETTRENLKDLPEGWLYVFHGRHLRKEIRIESDPGRVSYSNVPLESQQGYNRRQPQGRYDHLLLQTHELNKPVRVGLAFSRVQWSWARVKAMGGLNENDERYNNELERSNAQACFDPDSVDVSRNAELAESRIQWFDLASYWDNRQDESKLDEHMYIKKEENDDGHALILGLYDPIGIALKLAAEAGSHYEEAENEFKYIKNKKHFDYAVAVNALVNAPEPDIESIQGNFEAYAEEKESLVNNISEKAELYDRGFYKTITQGGRIHSDDYRRLLSVSIESEEEINRRTRFLQAVKTQSGARPSGYVQFASRFMPGYEELADKVAKDVLGQGDIALTNEEEEHIKEYLLKKEEYDGIRRSMKDQKKLSEYVNVEGLHKYLEPPELTAEFDAMEDKRTEYFKWLMNQTKDGQPYTNLEPQALLIEHALADYASLAVNVYYPIPDENSKILVPEPPSIVILNTKQGSYLDNDSALRDFASKFIKDPEMWVKLRERDRIFQTEHVLYVGDKVQLRYHQNVPRLEIVSRSGSKDIAVFIPSIDSINSTLEAGHIKMTMEEARKATHHQEHLKHPSYLYWFDMHLILMTPSEYVRGTIDPVYKSLKQSKDGKETGLYQPGLDEDDAYLEFLEYLAEPDNPWMKMLNPTDECVSPTDPVDKINTLVINDGSGDFRALDYFRQCHLLKETWNPALGTDLAAAIYPEEYHVRSIQKDGLERDMGGSTLASADQRIVDVVRTILDKHQKQFNAWISQSLNQLTALKHLREQLVRRSMEVAQERDELRQRRNELNNEEARARSAQPRQSGKEKVFLDFYVKTSRLSFIHELNGLHLGTMGDLIPEGYVVLDGQRHIVHAQKLSKEEIRKVLEHESQNPGRGSELTRNGQVIAHSRISRVGFFKRRPAYNRKFDLDKYWQYHANEPNKGRSQHQVDGSITKISIVMVRENSPLLEREQRLLQQTQRELVDINRELRTIETRLRQLDNIDKTLTDQEIYRRERINQERLSVRENTVRTMFNRSAHAGLSAYFLHVEIMTLKGIMDGQFDKESDLYIKCITALSVLGTITSAYALVESAPVLFNGTRELMTGRTVGSVVKPVLGSAFFKGLNVFSGFGLAAFALMEASNSFARGELLVAGLQVASGAIALIMIKVPHPGFILIGLGLMLLIGIFKRNELENLLALSMFGTEGIAEYGIAKYGTDYEWMNQDGRALEAYQYLLGMLAPMQMDIENLAITSNPEDPALTTEEQGQFALTISYPSVPGASQPELKLFVLEFSGTPRGETIEWQLGQRTLVATLQELAEKNLGSPHVYNRDGLEHVMKYHDYANFLTPLKEIEPAAPGKRYLYQATATPGKVSAILAFAQLQYPEGFTLPAPERRYQSGDIIPEDNALTEGWITCGPGLIHHQRHV